MDFIKNSRIYKYFYFIPILGVVNRNQVIVFEVFITDNLIILQATVITQKSFSLSLKRETLLSLVIFFEIFDAETFKRQPFWNYTKEILCAWYKCKLYKKLGGGGNLIHFQSYNFCVKNKMVDNKTVWSNYFWASCILRW